jgi:hypothetical protein
MKLYIENFWATPGRQPQHRGSRFLSKQLQRPLSSGEGSVDTLPRNRKCAEDSAHYSRIPVSALCVCQARLDVEWWAAFSPPEKL